MDAERIGSLEGSVVSAIDDGHTTLGRLCRALKERPDRIVRALRQAVDHGFVTDLRLEPGTHLELTDAGRIRAAADDPPDLEDDGDDLDPALRMVIAREIAREAMRHASAERDHDEVLVGDADRETTTSLLADAYAQGRITIEDLQRRTDLALRARDRGDVEDATRGLVSPDPTPAVIDATSAAAAGSDPKADAGRGRRLAAFVVLAVIMAPFLFLGAMLLLAGQDLGDHLFGLVMLIVLLPGLVAVGRWAIRR